MNAFELSDSHSGCHAIVFSHNFFKTQKRVYICKKENTIKLTIEIGNPSEMEQLHHVFSRMNLESIHVVIV